MSGDIGTITFSSPNVYTSYAARSFSRSLTTITGLARSDSVMPDGTFTSSRRPYTVSILPALTKITVSSTFGIIPSSILPMNRCMASMGEFACTTPTIPTPVILRSANVSKSSLRRTSSNMV